MKKAFFALAAVLMMVSVVNVQAASKSKGFDKKNVYVGGSVGFTSTTVSYPGGGSEDGSSLKLIFDLGYDLNKTNSVGAQIGVFTGLASLGSLDVVNLSSLVWAAGGAAMDLSTDDTFGFHFAPYIRHNLISNNTFDVFVEGVLGFDSVKSTTGDPDTGDDMTTKATVFELIARPGVAMKLGKDFKLTTRFGAAGYQSLSSKRGTGGAYVDGPTVSRFGVDVSSANLIFGLEYHF